MKTTPLFSQIPPKIIGKNVQMLVLIVVLGIMVVYFLESMQKALDAQIDGQNVMLCKSAIISGNEDYGQKCQCYYDGQGAACLRNKLK